MTYYAFFHPTGVEINMCCFQRSGRTEEVEESEPNSHLERPHFLDLRESAPQTCDSENSENRDRGPQLENGEFGSSSYARSKSRLSVSRSDLFTFSFVIFKYSNAKKAKNSQSFCFYPLVKISMFRLSQHSQC